MVDFSQHNITATEQDLICRIADRAIGHGMYDKTQKLTCVMDVELVHVKMGLKLEKLIDADTGNFCHDLNGIRTYLNRRTGELEQCFVPRYALSQHKHG